MSTARVAVAGAVRRNWPFLLVVIIASIGIASTAIAPQHWLRGVMVCALGLGVGAALRIVLPGERVGLLAVRSKPIDVLCLATLAVLIVTVGVLLPH